MKKIAVLMFCLLLLTSCKIAAESSKDSEHKSINIFDKYSDLAVDYIPKEKVILNDITDEVYKEAALIYESGLTEHVPVSMHFDGGMEAVFTLDINNLNGLKGIYLYDEIHSITDAYYNTKKLLDNDENVMFVFLDGFSYEQYKYAKEKGCVNFLSKFYRNEALSVYTPVTNAGYAAIITGQTPDINGVHDRSCREMKVESIFQYVLNNNKQSILLEGDIKILNTEIEPVLHIDTNKDDDTDDEMYESTIKAAKEDYDYIFVHFHGIDDRGHSYGPYSDETMKYIKKIDGCMEQLNTVWDGSIILTADHGMHETPDGGSHGECRASDMVVPYFMIK